MIFEAQTPLIDCCFLALCILGVIEALRQMRIAYKNQERDDHE